MNGARKCNAPGTAAAHVPQNTQLPGIWFVRASVKPTPAKVNRRSAAKPSETTCSFEAFARARAVGPVVRTPCVGLLLGAEDSEGGTDEGNDEDDGIGGITDGIPP